MFYDKQNYKQIVINKIILKFKNSSKSSDGHK